MVVPKTSLCSPQPRDPGRELFGVRYIGFADLLRLGLEVRDLLPDEADHLVAFIAQSEVGVAAVSADRDRAVSERSPHSRNFKTSAAIGSKLRFHRMDISGAAGLPRHSVHTRCTHTVRIRTSSLLKNPSP
jgi:hypothetical protein